MDPEQEQVAKKAAKALKARIDLVQKHLDPILSGPLSETYGKLPTTEKAQFEVLLSFALNSLYYIYLKTHGVNPLDHQVTNELQRIKQYIEKIKVAEGRGPKRSMELDKDAADRFIKSALAGDEQQQSGEGMCLPMMWLCKCEGWWCWKDTVREKEGGFFKVQEGFNFIGMKDEEKGETSRKRHLEKEKSRGEEEVSATASSSNKNGTRKRPRMDPFAAPRNGSY
ncbi:hypothetical protein BDB00DRAFT_379688 [Zychaea mexicana]|uniref:uncharacterized protein n=1 Tax=Zychaea mexicana TaxID=64656 RepID=UPI0022FE141B|nr:uncharacterized protein BDB00DRAFT_379688 [Zychaea mexicana]KAI9493213.1 hypothetical protein BDB00DRAFT_379688 [Zychaea mexicana]